MTPDSQLQDTPLVAADSDADRFDRAFDRAAGAPLTRRNAVRLLLDARENFPAWLASIAAAQRYVLFESYIIADDRVGHEFIEALADQGARRRAGVRRLRLAGLDQVQQAVGAAARGRARTCAASIRRASTARSRGSRATIASRSSSTARSRS